MDVDNSESGHDGRTWACSDDKKIREGTIYEPQSPKKDYILRAGELIRAKAVNIQEHDGGCSSHGNDETLGYKEEDFSFSRVFNRMGDDDQEDADTYTPGKWTMVDRDHANCKIEVRWKFTRLAD